MYVYASFKRFSFKREKILYFKNVTNKTLPNFVTGMSASMDQHYILILLRLFWHQRDSKLEVSLAHLSSNENSNAPKRGSIINSFTPFHLWSIVYFVMGMYI